MAQLGWKPISPVERGSAASRPLDIVGPPPMPPSHSGPCSLAVQPVLYGRRQTTRHGRGTPRGHKKDPLAGAAGEEASLCVVFQRNASTAMPDLDSGVGTGLGDRVVFLDRVAYCPLQYALRSPTMNRVEMESSLSSSCSDKNTSVPASAKVRILGLAVKKTGVARRLESLRPHRPLFIL